MILTNANQRAAKTLSTLLCALLCAAALGISGCFVGGTGTIVNTGELQTENVAIPPGTAKSVDVHLQMGAGELNVSGGSSQLLDGKISYNVPSWKPDVSYTVQNGKGSLMVMQPADTHTTLGGAKYTWNLHLNNAMPMTVAVEMGAGNSRLNFSGMALRHLDVQMGAGNSTVDLSGAWKQDVSVSIQGGVGQAHVTLPRDVGVRVSVQGGLGSVSAPDFQRDGDDYVNSANGKSPVTITVNISGGIGSVYLELAGQRPIV